MSLHRSPLSYSEEHWAHGDDPNRGRCALNAIGLIAVIVSVWLVGCSSATESRQPSATPSLPSPMPTSTSVPPTASAVPKPSPTPTATLAPTVDPTVISATIKAGAEAISRRGVDPLCIEYRDADDDGTPEWVGLYLQPDASPRLLGFVLDEDKWFALAPPSGDDGGMGTFPACELRIEDLNADGRTELLVRGKGLRNIDLLNIFVWEEGRYRLLASFHGDAGVVVEDVDGDLIPEIIGRYEAGTGLAWEAVHTWDGSHYAWTWERYNWLFPDHPHAYPTEQPRSTVISFYLALAGRDLPRAYALLSAAAQDAQPYQEWASGFNTTLDADVGAVREIERATESAQVTAQVRSYDNVEGYVIGRLWDVRWRLIREDDAWRLQDSQAEKLDEWEAEYFR